MTRITPVSALIWLLSTSGCFADGSESEQPDPSTIAYTADDLYLFYTTDDCLWGQSEIDFGGAVKSDVLNVSTSFLLLPCAWPYNRPIGWLATAIQNWRWNGVGWDLCADSGWLFNQSQSASNSYNWNLGGACGGGWYGTLGGVYVWKDEAWKGGWVWSGAEHLILMTDNASQTSTTPQPARPAWVKADGTVDVSAMPAQVNLLGTDGKPTGLAVDPRALIATPAIPGAVAPSDPAGIERMSKIAESGNGPPYTTETVTLTDDFQGRYVP